MSDTTMYTKGLDDGWFLVASAADNVSIKSNSDGFWHVAVADALPTDAFVGEKHSGIGVKQITGLSGKVYLRAASAHSFAVTVGALQQGVTYGLDDSGALVAQGMVGNAVKVNSSDFTPSSYDADLTMDDTAQSGAIATGATKLQFGNLGATTESIRVAFGATASEAEGNLNIAAGAATTGYYIPSIADAGAGAFVNLGVPSAALGGFYAVANAVAADTQTVAVNQGV